MNKPKIEIELTEILKDLQSGQKETLDEMRSGQKEILKEISDFKEETRSRFGQIENRLVAIETRMDEQKSSIAKIPDLAEKVGELKNWRQIALIVIAGTVSGILGWLLRGGRV